MYQELYDKTKNLMQQGTCMKCYDALKSLYLEQMHLLLAWGCPVRGKRLHEFVDETRFLTTLHCTPLHSQARVYPA